ncbi:MAG TPA: hypothetical protein VIQ76_15880, partial [Propionibacteriaceae bacterium]
MLLRATLPSRPELMALAGQNADLSRENWRAFSDGAISLLGIVELYLPKLDQYLCTGLRVRETGRRDALITAAMLPFVESEEVAEPESVETRLFRATREAACAEGLATLVPGMPASGPVALEAAVRLLKGEIHAQATSKTWHRGSEGSATGFAAIISAVLAAAPVWLVEPEFVDRLARARELYTAAI